MKKKTEASTTDLRRDLKRLHFPLEVVLTCVRWYVAYSLSLCHLEEMMAERGVVVDHSTVHRWALKLLPVPDAVFQRRKRIVARRWRMDETYVKINGQSKYLSVKRIIRPMLDSNRTVAPASCWPASNSME
jgi:transposase-like protein